MDTLVKSWEDIAKEFEAMEQLSCVPENISKVRPGFVFDREKSVRWNEEEVDRNNVAYLKEVSRLNTIKNKERDRILEDIYKAIKYEVGHNLSREKAILLWNYAWDKGHSFGIYEILNHLYEIMEIADKLLSKSRG